MPKGSIKIEGLEGIELTNKQVAFCQEYCRNGWNGTKAALFAGYSENTVKDISAENLSKPAIKAYIEKIKNDFELLCGISKAKVLDEHYKLAFSSIAHLHNTWIERKEFNKLTNDQKDCIAEIDTKIIREMRYNDESGKKDLPVEIEYVKIKLYDKQKALDSIAKLMGYESAIKTQELPTELSEQETKLRIQKLEKELGIE